MAKLKLPFIHNLLKKRNRNKPPGQTELVTPCANSRQNTEYIRTVILWLNDSQYIRNKIVNKSGYDVWVAMLAISFIIQNWRDGKYLLLSLFSKGASSGRGNSYCDKNNDIQFQSRHQPDTFNFPNPKIIPQIIENYQKIGEYYKKVG